MDPNVRRMRETDAAISPRNIGRTVANGAVLASLCDISVAYVVEGVKSNMSVSNQTTAVRRMDRRTKKI